MNDTGITVVFLILCLLIGAIGGYGMGSNENKVALAECEKDLPRSQHCTMIAIPVDQN
jgi:Na+-transporting methylmalonyl-CoA/oxaloacetate decarboxylase gamma subunit